MAREARKLPLDVALQRRASINIVVVALAIVVFFIGSTFYAQRIAVGLDERAVSIATNASPAIEALSAARGDLLRIQLATAQAIDTGFPNEAVKEGFARLHEHLQTYLNLPLYPGEQAHWGAVERCVSELEKQAALVLAESAAGHEERARKLLEGAEWSAAEAADKALESLVAFNADEQHRLGLEIPYLRHRAEHTAYVLDGISGLLALLLLGTVLVDHRRRMRLLVKFGHRLEGMAAASMRVSETIASKTDLPVLFQRIVDEARATLDADYAGLGVGTDKSMSFQPWVVSGMSPDEVRVLARAPRPIGVLGKVVHFDGPLRIADVTRDPAFGGVPPSHPPMAAFLGVPVRREGRSVANLYLARRPGRPPFTEEDEYVIELFGAHAAVAADNAELYRQLRRERSTLQLLADSSETMIRSLSYPETIARIAQALVPSFADLCTINMLDSNHSWEPPVIAAAQPEWAAMMEESARRYPTLSESHPVARARRERCSNIALRTRELLQQKAEDSDHLALLERLPMRSVLSVPLVVRDELIGVCSFLSVEEAHFGPAEVTLAEEVARRAALSIENARLHEKAEAAIRMREDVLAMVSHDLKNPLSAIQLGAGILSARADQGEQEIRRHAARITRASLTMSRLIADLLDAAKIDSGTLAADRSVEDIDALLVDALGMFKESAAEKSVRLISRLAASVPDIRLDRDRMLQVFSNLIGNALKFTPPGGTITVSVEPQEGRVQFSVTDTGPGIRPDHLPHLFDRYWQSRESRRGGAGLGLYITKGIVEAHGGQIWADCKPGSGAVFYFTLPAPESRATS